MLPRQLWRVGYCSRDVVAEACPYANIFGQCDNFVTTAEFVPALDKQLADVRAPLHDDATERGWHSEVARDACVIAKNRRPPPTTHQLELIAHSVRDLR